MKDFSCCSSCSGVSYGSVFPMGSYIPYEPGYPQTYSLPKFKTVGMAGPLMGQPVARPYPSAEPLPIGSVTATYNRGEGRYKPYISLPTFNGFSNYAKTGDPATFNPVSNYAGTGNPCGFNPLSSYAVTGDPATFNPLSAIPSPSNPTGSLNPVGESLPANIGHPTRIGNGIGGVDTLGSWYNDDPFNPIY